jgi:histidinol-phosphate phosphatase family protein
MRKQHAILLDLNGTLNDKGGYCHASELEITSWAMKAVQRFNEHGLPVAIVSNQSGIADKKFSNEEFREGLGRILTLLEQHETFIEAIYYCPHSKEDNCPNKKPKDGMILRVCKDLEVELQHCFMIGDTGYSDMQAGYRAGCKLILVQTGYGKSSLEVPEYRAAWQHITPNFIAENVLEAATWICSILPKQSWTHQPTKIVSL